MSSCIDLAEEFLLLSNRSIMCYYFTVAHAEYYSFYPTRAYPYPDFRGHYVIASCPRGKGGNYPRASLDAAIAPAGLTCSPKLQFRRTPGTETLLRYENAATAHRDVHDTRASTTRCRGGNQMPACLRQDSFSRKPRSLMNEARDS